MSNTSASGISQNFRSMGEWFDWLHSNPWAVQPDYITANVQEVARCGFIDPLFGYVSPSQVDTSSDNYREGIVAHNLNSRLRAVCLQLSEELLRSGPRLRVYASEWVSPFAEIVRKFVDYHGSEYLPTPSERAAFPHIRHEDVTALSWENESFDAYITNEVLEHVHNIERALSEAYRILKPKGIFFGTFPMAYASESTVHKAKIVNGELVHLMEPEYHGNPIDPSGGSLVFGIPGWDIISQARACGFKDPHIRFLSSRRHGIYGAEIAGVLLFVARKL